MGRTTPKGLLVAARTAIAAAMLIAGASLVATTVAGAATTIYVANHGGGSGGCATPADTSIAAGVSDAGPGGTVIVCPGTYMENVTIPSTDAGLTIEGSGQGSTIVEPQYSNPTGYGDVTANQFDSTVFLVQADNVTIQDLTINGSNPSAVTSPAPWSAGAPCDSTWAAYGEDGGCAGVTINAAAGIDTGIPSCQAPACAVTGMSVQDVAIENVYSVGIANRSFAGTFNFSNDTITNVGGTGQGIFTYEANGTISNDAVSWAGVGIQSNWGAISATGNTIENSNWGIFMGNIGEPAGYAGGASTTISDNAISSCWGQSFFAGASTGDSELGITLFAPFAPTAETVSNNTVTGCSTGLAAFSSNNDEPGTFATPVVTFSGNTVDGQNASGGIGALVSTDKLGFNNGPVDAQFSGNTISNVPTALYTDETNLDNWANSGDSALPGGLTVSASGNQFDGGWFNDATGPIAASGNWWGNTSGPSVSIGAPDSESSATLISRAAPTWWTTPDGLPSAPRSVGTTRGSHQVAMSWSAPLLTGSSSPSVTITGYTATASPGGSSCSTASLGCTITGLTNGTTYSLTVRATNGFGTGAASSPVSVTPSALPGAPRSPKATPGNGSALVQWSPPPATGGITLSGYTATSSPGGLTCSTTGATECTVTGLTDGTPYTFTVTAANAAGTGPASLASASVTPATTGYHIYALPPVVEVGGQVLLSATGAQSRSFVIFKVARQASKHSSADAFGAASVKFKLSKLGAYRVSAKNMRAFAYGTVYAAKVKAPASALHIYEIPVSVRSAIPGSKLEVTTSDDGTFSVPVPSNGNVVVELPRAPYGSCVVTVSDNGYLLSTQTINVS